MEQGLKGITKKEIWGNIKELFTIPIGCQLRKSLL